MLTPTGCALVVRSAGNFLFLWLLFRSLSSSHSLPDWDARFGFSPFSLVKAFVADVAAHDEVFRLLDLSAKEFAKAVSEAQEAAPSADPEPAETEDPVATVARLRGRFEELRGVVEQRLGAMFLLGEALTNFLSLCNGLSQALCAIDADLRELDRAGESEEAPTSERLAVTSPVPCARFIDSRLPACVLSSSSSQPPEPRPLVEQWPLFLCRKSTPTLTSTPKTLNR